MATPRRPPRSERWWYRYAHAQPSVALATTRERPALVHGLGGDATALFPTARQVVTVHDVVPWTNPARTGPAIHAYLELQRRLIRRVGAVIVPGEPIADDVAEALAVPTERITVVPHGIAAAFTPSSAPEDAAVRGRLGVPDRYVLWVGSLYGPDPRKGLDVLFEGLGRIHPALRPPLVLAGRAGAGAIWAQQQASRADVTLLLTDYVTDQTLAALYRGATAAVVPSRHEGFGLPAAEALACGAPLLVTDAGTLPSVVGQAALVVSAGRAEAIADGLSAILSEPQLAAHLRSLGPMRAAQFSWARAAERTVEVYERLIPRFGR